MALIKPEDLTNRKFEIQEGRLRFFAAEKAVFVVGQFESHHQILQVVFSRKDGSIFLSTPYFGSGSGVVCSASVPLKPPYTISLDDGGKVTSHLVKLSHHPDGRVHFSQSGKVRTEIRRQAFPLADSIGQVFALHVYHPTAFAPIEFAKQKLDRVYLRTVFKQRLPEAIMIVGEWRRKVDIEANTETPSTVVPSVTSAMHRRTGQLSIVTLLGQPVGWPLRDHLLVLLPRPLNS